MIMSSEIERMLQGFLDDTVSPDEFEAWLVAATTNGCFLESERDALWRLRATLTDASEGIASLGDVRAVAALIILESSGEPTTAGVTRPQEFTFSFTSDSVPTPL